MGPDTTHPWRRGIYVVALVAAVGSFAVTIASEPLTFTPRTVFGVTATLIVVVVALGGLFGSNTPVREGVTYAHLALVLVWLVYLFAGVALVLAGFTEWVVLSNLAIAVGAGLLFGYLYTRE